LVSAGPGRAVVEVASLTDTTTADLMTWHVTDLGFRMGLSAQVPEILSRYVRPLITDLLDRHSLAVDGVGGWAVHPGGPRILDVVAEQLGLGEAAMAASRDGLAVHGNCSSPTVLLILERLLQERAMASGGAGPIVLMAFGPGLTLYAGLIA
jgi:predicted naringenin-chalcone synthase